MTNTIALLDVVALTEDLPDVGLERGQVGTVVEELPPDAFLVEFSDHTGEAYAIEPVEQSRLMLLKHKPAKKLTWP
jgi:hypothetical protein